MARSKHLIKLVSSESSHYYTTKLSSTTHKAGKKLSRRKYDPKLRKHVKYTQSKVK